LSAVFVFGGPPPLVFLTPRQVTFTVLAFPCPVSRVAPFLRMLLSSVLVCHRHRRILHLRTAALFAWIFFPPRPFFSVHVLDGGTSVSTSVSNALFLPTPTRLVTLPLVAFLQAIIPWWVHFSLRLRIPDSCFSVPPLEYKTSSVTPSFFTFFIPALRSLPCFLEIPSSHPEFCILNINRMPLNRPPSTRSTRVPLVAPGTSIYSSWFIEHELNLRLAEQAPFFSSFIQPFSGSAGS